eukprot:TRINITY_DN6524_c0_g1_i2.p1 TRINITY_DN6524_c0_g1~~TRINITY_DN6524_c0_g1_i2.p1  ORF type:complete len:568 (+),score=95.79 TRINITY_DN6524_c0_g1_i2:573-2276(+)
MFRYRDGSYNVSKYNSPWGVCCDADDNIYVSDHRNHVIRRIDKEWVSETYYGVKSRNNFINDKGIFFERENFSFPCGVCIDSFGDLIVSDYDNNRICIVGNGEMKEVVIDTDTKPNFSSPCGVSMDHKGSIIVADKGSHRIIRVSLTPRLACVIKHGFLLERVRSLYKSEHSTNIRIQTRDSYCKAHRCIILARSPRLLEDKFIEIIKGIKSKHFKIILEYLYTDKCEETLNSDLTFEDLFLLVKYAGKLYMKRLKSIVLIYQKKVIDQENIFGYIECCKKYPKIDNCYDFAIEFLQTHQYLIDFSDNWKKEILEEAINYICCPSTIVLPSSTIVSDLFPIIDKHKFSDIELKITDTFGIKDTLHVHKCIIMENSEMFGANFQFNEIADCVDHVSPLPLSSFSALVSYWYTGKLNCSFTDLFCLLVWGSYYQTRHSEELNRSIQFSLRYMDQDEIEGVKDFISQEFDNYMINEVLLQTEVEIITPELYWYCHSLLAQQVSINELLTGHPKIIKKIELIVNKISISSQDIDHDSFESLQNQITDLKHLISELDGEMDEVIDILEKKKK